jgi:diguanylate cyclase (GGDEF)-like protein
MDKTIFLSDPSWSTEPYEVVVAVVIIIFTGVALFFLYRNVVWHFKQNKLEKIGKTPVRDFSETNSDKLTFRTASRHPLLGQINNDIYHIKEGDLRLFFAINIDNFRYIVDSYEQKDVDKIIEELTKRIKKYCGKNCISGHYEKDVFVLYYKGDINNEKISEVGNELLELIKKPVKIGNHQLTASIGICLFPYDAITAEKLLKNAEVAIYAAKKQGKNRFYIYSEQLIENEQFNMDYYKQIKNSIEKDEFILYYQPIVDIRTGKIIGLESLLRWKHPTMGILPPGKFLNIMDLTGDITWFGVWGFEKVVSQFKEWNKKIKLGDFYISMNLHPKQLFVEGLARELFDITNKHAVSPENFCLEIVDYYTSTKSEVAINNLKEFRRFGFRLAIDDVGPDYSIINDMSKVSAPIFKISRGNMLHFISEAEDNDKMLQVIDAAKENQKIIIAEGIEDEDAIRILNKHDIRFMQGYYFSQPIAIEEVEKLLYKSPWDMSSFNRIIK